MKSCNEHMIKIDVVRLHYSKQCTKQKTCWEVKIEDEVELTTHRPRELARSDAVVKLGEIKLAIIFYSIPFSSAHRLVLLPCIHYCYICLENTSKWKFIQNLFCIRTTKNENDTGKCNSESFYLWQRHSRLKAFIMDGNAGKQFLFILLRRELSFQEATMLYDTVAQYYKSKQNSLRSISLFQYNSYITLSGSFTYRCLLDIVIAL